MTKTEYRQYIASEDWQRRRRRFLAIDGNDKCAVCGVPRGEAIKLFDQDLHVHHRSYANLGAEPDEDLQPLCRRCHEIETFGQSVLMPFTGPFKESWHFMLATIVCAYGSETVEDFQRKYLQNKSANEKRRIFYEDVTEGIF